MNIKYAAPALLGLLGTALTGSAIAQGAAEGNGLPAEVRGSIVNRIEAGRNVGIVIGIIDSSGSRYYGFGRVLLPDGAAPDEHTVFEIGSVTKVFTTTILADMVVRGDIRLTDPITEYLPPTVSAPSGNDRQITLADLATHTSGLPRLPSNLIPADTANPYADYTVDQMYSFLSGYTLLRDVGAEFEYSNFGMGLLGHLLAQIGRASCRERV